MSTTEKTEGPEERGIRRLKHADNLNLTPADISQQLGKWVIGQDEAVRAVSVALYQHLVTRVRRVARGMMTMFPVRIPPILLMGPTGCGKSQLLRAAARITGLPAYLADASSLTAEGYVGSSVSEWIRALISMSEGYLPLAECGLLLVDECDKKASKASYFRDVAGSDAQDGLLRLLDSGHIGVEVIDNVNGLGQRKHLPVRVDHMLVWAAGAFSGNGGSIEEIVARRIHTRRRLGFGATGATADGMSPAELRRRVIPSDLITYGLKPELVARLQRIVVMSDLSADAMRTILCDVPDGPVPMVQGIARSLGFRFEFANTLVDEIVRRATASGLGARALSGLVAKATEAAWMGIPERLKDKKAHPWGKTVVTLRRDSLDSGWFGMRVEERKGKAAPSPAAGAVVVESGESNAAVG
jgi:ATP-dependent Clp protease ATP-binding subunit ClpX